MEGTPGPQTVSTELLRIAKQAVCYPHTIFNNLYQRINVDMLREVYRRTRKDVAPGFDKITAAEYAENLEENLKDLCESLKMGRYKAPPVERVWLDKEDGRKRPIGKPTFEDKIVQRSVEMVLSAIYEQMFYEFSHAFRKGHSQHQALHELREQCRKLNIGWIISVDIKGLFEI